MNPSRILLADDDISVREALGNLLECEGFEVVRAADGLEAIEKSRQRQTDLVLLDLNMPRKGGWQTLVRLKNVNPLLPIIVITARSDARAAALAGGATAVMQKPLDIPRLLEAMRESLVETLVPRTSLCPLCQAAPAAEVTSHLASEAEATGECTLRMIETLHPGWAQAQGACGSCWSFYTNLVRVLNASGSFEPRFRLPGSHAHFARI